MKSKKISAIGVSHGIGQAIALQLARESYTLLSSTRTEGFLEDTIGIILSNAAYQMIAANFLKQERAFSSSLKITNYSKRVLTIANS